MSVENKALVRRYFEAIDRGDLAAIDELFASTYVRHDANAPEVRGLYERYTKIWSYAVAGPA
jgi:ketosteroid isomerase-like protein